MSSSRWLGVDSRDWPAALSAVEHDVYHLPAYVALEARRLGGEPRLFLYEDGGLRFLVPLVIRAIPGTSARDATSPYGYPGPTVTRGAGSDFVGRACRALWSALGEIGLIAAFVRLHPLLSPDLSDRRSLGTLVRHGPTVSIDLTPDEDAMQAAMRPGHRNEIERTREAGLVFALDPSWDRLGGFERLYAETMRRVGAAPDYLFDRAYFEGLRDLRGAWTALAGVTRGEELLAAAVFTEVRGLVQYHLAASRRGRGALQPAKFLLDEMRRWSARRGHHSLHLGGGAGAREDGVFRFKKGFSGRLHEFSTWRMVLDEKGYASCCSVRGVDVGGDFFPAYRKPPGVH